jgi:TrmH family RNA methyltransferase
MSKDCVDIYNPKVIRSTMGSIYRMPFCYVEDIAETITQMKSQGIRTYAAHLQDSVDYDEPDYRKPCAFLIGNEGNGLKKETADLADTYVKIPMEGQVESLNAAIAATVLMFEVSRQRRRK